MLAESTPQRRVGFSIYRVGAYANHSGAVTAAGTMLAWLKKEINAPFRPVHSAVAISQSALPAYAPLQFSQVCVERVGVVNPAHFLSAIAIAYQSEVPSLELEHEQTGVQPVFKVLAVTSSGKDDYLISIR